MTECLASILRYCHDNFIGTVPQSVNTGLCGGATPLHDEVIVSLEGMNNIYSVDVHSGILTRARVRLGYHDYEYVIPLYFSHRNESGITQSMTDEVSPSMIRAQVFPNIRA